MFDSRGVQGAAAEPHNYTVIDLLHHFFDITILLLDSIIIIVVVVVVVVALFIRFYLRRRRRQHSASGLERLDLGLGHLEHVLAQMLDALHLRDALGGHLCVHLSLRGKHLTSHKGEFIGPLEEVLKGFAELEAGFKDCAAAENVQA